MGLAGDNFDVLQIAVLNFISLGENDKAKTILRLLVNENYNAGLNGLLLSRIYFRWDKNREEYDILRDRIGNQNVIPWIENDVEADKKFIEDRENAIFHQFAKFMEAFDIKYRNLFNQSIGYNKTLRLKKQVEWCLSIDATDMLVDVSNKMFYELIDNKLFSIQKQTDNKPWKDFFIEQSVLLNEKIAKFYGIEAKVKNAIIEIMEKNPFGVLEGMNVIADTAGKAADNVGKAFDGLNKALDGKLNILKTGTNVIGNIAGKAVDVAGKAIDSKHIANLSGNEAEQEKLKSAIKVLIQSCDFDKYIADFITAIKNEFKKGLTVESAVSLQENMLIIINKWYRENGFEVYDDSSEGFELDKPSPVSDDLFFKYPECFI
jgi:hypothetical protein